MARLKVTVRCVLSAGGVALMSAVLGGDLQAASPQAAHSLTGVVRDFVCGSANPDFATSPVAAPGARSAANIAANLDIGGKPVYVGAGKRVQKEWRDGSSNHNQISWCAPICNSPPDEEGEFGIDDGGGISSAESFAQWFRDVPGVNMSALCNIELTKDHPEDPDDVWEFHAKNFYPIDEQLFGNGSDPHNYCFTFELVCNFTYHAADDQFFWLKGDDDAWVFIDGKLAIDHGGIAATREQRIDFNRMSLIDGETYKLHLFLAERYQPQSNFHIKTNVELESTGGQTIFAAFD
jgi:fibro-slime domain-containing protein